METHINVTLHDGGRIRDLRIPTHIEVRRLIKELDSIFEKENARKNTNSMLLIRGSFWTKGKY